MPISLRTTQGGPCGCTFPRDRELLALTVAVAFDQTQIPQSQLRTPPVSWTWTVRVAMFTVLQLESFLGQARSAH